MELYKLSVLIGFLGLLQIETPLAQGLFESTIQDLDCFKYDSSCGTCIQNPSCQWCSQFAGNDDAHCFARSSDIRAKCKTSDIHNPLSRASIILNEDLSEFIKDKRFRALRKKVIQIRPQKFRLRLRKGDPVTIQVTYRQLEDYPLDLYYLMDLSKSMKPHKVTLAKLGNQLAERMRALTTRFRLGFGSFVDKVLLPFVNTHPSKLENPCRGEYCETPYSFKNNLKLTEDDEEFKRRVEAADMSSNLDSPEGGFDALMQAMVCKEEIGWSEQVRKIIVFSTDATFHMAGDGKLAGVVTPNDAECRTRNGTYLDYDKYDYPSVGQISEIAQKKGINIIFAVKGKKTLYNALSNRIEGSHYAPLTTSRDKKGNLIDIVEEVYNSITSKVEIKQSSDTLDKLISVKVESNCKRDGVTFEPLDFCEGVQEGQDVLFNITVKLNDCPEQMTDRRRIIKVGTLQETIEIEIDMLCDCDCEIGSVSSAARGDCSLAGGKHCGVCICDPGAFGKKCQCSAGGINNRTSSKSDIDKCRDVATHGGAAKVCSGQGRCECETCNCKKDHDGKYCQCNNALCRHQPDANVHCYGNGNCHCGKCKCDKGWKGDFCQCPDEHACIKPGSRKVCSGNGDCECGLCSCFQDVIPYTGEFCEECPTCDNGQCEKFKDCVQCRFFKTGMMSEEQCENCNITVQPLPTLENAQEEHASLCTYLDEQTRCQFSFSYRFISKKNYEIFVKDKQDCPEPINFLAVTSGVVGTVVAIGILSILIWKVVTTIHDRREYTKFMKAMDNIKWGANENELYVDPNITVANPAFQQKL